ncbi:MAG: SMP-30/Gluconolaconase/LRE-like region [Chthonomonadaceae bacterium]|nr:SMP-30/Gluconolaconase/LRE-like region [Chthonomonadaceae bacterium]
MMTPTNTHRRLPGSACLALGLLSVLGFIGCGGSGSSNTTTTTPTTSTIAGLQHIATLSSTVDPQNRDQNPYALEIAPTFAGDGNPAHVQPGDIVVSNFSNAAGTNGAGTTVEAIRNGQPVRVFQESGATTAAGGSVSSSGPVAIAFAPNGTLWIANYGVTGVDGNVQIVSPAGIVDQTLNDPRVVAGWGQAYNGGFGGKLAFFTTNVSTGVVSRINITTDIYGQTSFTIDPLTGDLGHRGTSASTVVGPQGLVHTADDTLYVANGANSSLIAIPNSSTSGLTAGKTVFQGKPINQPVGLTVNPINGDLIIANQADNNLVEITTAGAVVGTKTVDSTVVNPTAGTGAALFGLVATKDSAGNLSVYFTNDNDNTVKILSK